MKVTINFGEISPELRSRSVARKVFHGLDKKMNYGLNFNNVTMMSRSFADEIFEFIESIGKSNIKIENANANIQSILDIVEKNRNSKREFEVTGDTKSFDRVEELKKYLESE